MASALQDLLARNPDVSTLMMFSNCFRSFGPYEAFVKALESRTPARVDACIALANYYHWKEQRDRALAQYERAAALTWVSPGTDNFGTELRRLAETLDLPEQEHSAPSPGAMERLGLTPLAALDAPVSVNIESGTPAGVYVEENGAVTAVAALQVKDQNGAPILHTLQRTIDGEHSWSTRALFQDNDTTQLRVPGSDDQYLHCTLTRTGDHTWQVEFAPLP